MKTPLFIFSCCVYFLSSAQNPAFEERRNQYIDTTILNTNNDNANIMRAYRDLPLDTAVILDIVNDIPTRSTADFEIIGLIRMIYLTDGEYDSLILPMLDTIPFWLEPNDDLRSYWSENHWCMWNSSNWLLHEKFNRNIDNQLKNRLVHYLKMKVEYGFYEFFSPTYAPFTLKGLLNLADFAEDAEIKSLATSAAQRLLSELLLMVNDQGVFYPAAGRTFHSRYDAPYGDRHNHVLYLISGLGPIPANFSGAASFLATSSIDVTPIINSLSAQENLVLRIGHTIDSSFILNDTLSDFDRILFQWSGGGYFHPAFAAESAQLVEDYDIWGHPDFEEFATFSSATPEAIAGLANTINSISQSSVLMDVRLYIYKHHSLVLSSTQDYWKGSVGYQQFPIVANVGRTAVYTSSGEVLDWDNRTGFNSNNHLPYVEQKNNIALAMYWPDEQILSFGAFVGFNDIEVSLRFKDSDFDEVRELDSWLLGRQNENYIGIYRPCVETINGIRACSDATGMTWAYVLGDSSLYSSFDAFEGLISQATITESKTSQNGIANYYAQLVFDGETIAYNWGKDLTTGIKRNVEIIPLSIYPNPARELIFVEMENELDNFDKITLLDFNGRVVDHYLNHHGLINISDLSKGLYFIKVLKGEKEGYQKFLVE